MFSRIMSVTGFAAVLMCGCGTSTPPSPQRAGGTPTPLAGTETVMVTFYVRDMGERLELM
jgi:hypothetical protein